MKKIYTLLVGLVFSLTVSAQCTELFFSEYSEGSSNNKYLEIYNPTSSAVDLSTYSVFMINNGGSNAANNKTFQLYGTLDVGGVFVICTDQSNASILAVADTALSYPSVSHFNGDDGLCLLNGTDTIDVIGVRWVDPGTNWSVGSGSTLNTTLVRKFSVAQGQLDWAVGATEWDAYAIDEWSYAGAHSSTCGPATEPSSAASNPTQDAADVISIYSQSYTNPASIDYFPNWGQSTQYSVFEIGTDSMIKYGNLNYQGIDFNTNEIDASSMEYLHMDVWTADVNDLMVFPISRGGERSVTKGLTKGNWTSLDIPLSDYTSQGLSASDIFQLKLEDPARSGGTIFIDNVYFWKMPTLVYNVADIADVIMLDADLAATNEDALYELTGVVYGVDLDGNAGISFTIIDETAGINIFNFNDVDDYVVTEGDEITVKGKIDFYRGLLELVADSIKVNSSGNTLKSATQVEAPSEATESDFIVLRKVWITNDTTTVWPDNGNVELTNDAADTFQIRIDRDIPGIVGMPVAFDTMVIVGIGGQFDASAPYNEGYQIFPRGLGDITEWVRIIGSVKEGVIETRVYPNPTNSNLTVLGTQKWDTYQVFNILGGIVLEGSLSNNNLTVSELNGGTYIVKLYAGENTGVARFVVNR